MLDEIQKCLNCKLPECINCLWKKDRRSKHPKTVVNQIDVKTNEIVGTFPNIVAAMQATGVSTTCISRCIHKKQYSSGGYLWEREVIYG